MMDIDTLYREYGQLTHTLKKLTFRHNELEQMIERVRLQPKAEATSEEEGKDINASKKRNK